MTQTEKVFWRSYMDRGVDHLWRRLRLNNDYLTSACGLLLHECHAHTGGKRRCKNCERAIKR